MAFASDETIGNNLTSLRGSMSMELLAAKMRDLGNSWTKTTVFNIEHGKRQLRLSEAADVLSCLGFSPFEMWRYVIDSDDKMLVEALDAVNDLSDEFSDTVSQLNSERMKLVRIAALSSTDFDEDVVDLLETTTPSALSRYMKEEARTALSKWIVEESTDADGVGNSENTEKEMAQRYKPYWVYLNPDYTFDQVAYSKRRIEAWKKLMKNPDKASSNGVDS